MNSIHILGTITKTPEMRFTTGGTAVLKFSIAYNERRKQQDGSYTDKAHYFDVTAWGKKADVIKGYFDKGSRILVSGSLEHETWEKDGQKHSRVSIRLEDFDFIDKRQDGQAAPKAPEYRSENVPTNSAHDAGRGYKPKPMPENSYHDIDVDEDSIPF